MTCFKVIEIEGFAVLGWAVLSWLLLHKEAVKRNTDDLMKNMLLATAGCAFGYWLLDQFSPGEVHAGMLIAQYFYVFMLLAPFRFIVPFYHKAWNACRRLLQIVTVVPLVVLLGYYDVVNFNFSRLIDLVLILVMCVVMIVLRFVLDADIPCPNCRRYTVQDDRNVREARGELFDKRGDIVKCPYCGQIYHTKTGETYELVENQEAAPQSEAADNENNDNRE